MKLRRLLTSLAVGFSIAALSAGPAAAGPCPPNEDPFPASEGWEVAGFTFTIPADSGCDVAVEVYVGGHYRITVNGHAFPEDYQVQAGDRYHGVAPDAYVKITNKTNGKKVKVSTIRSWYERVTPNGTDIKGTNIGGNFYAGPGVKGLRWAEGVQKYIYHDVDVDGGVLEFYQIKGKSVELCHKLGAKPVPGKYIE